MLIAADLGREALGIRDGPRDLATQAREVEEQGFRSAWTVNFSTGQDALTALTAAALETERLALGVGVVPTFPRHPVALAQHALTVQALAGGRLTLGVGVSHRRVIEEMHGLSYDHPLAHLREYLQILGQLLTGGVCRFRGDHYSVEASVTVPGSSPVPLVVGALSEGTVSAAGELADGAVTWLAGPRVLADEIVPTLHGAAQDARRETPRLIAALPVAVCDDEAAAREAAADVFSLYPRLPNYQDLFAREGVSGPADLALVGDRETVGAGLRELAGLGVTEFWPVTFPIGDADQDTTRRTREALRELSRQL